MSQIHKSPWSKFEMELPPLFLWYILWIVVKVASKWKKYIREGIQKNIDFAKLWVSQICGFTTFRYELDWGFFKGNIVDIEESFSNSILHVQIQGHSTFVSLISMVRSQIVNLILTIFLGTTPIAHNSKWIMQSHFWYLSYNPSNDTLGTKFGPILLLHCGPKTFKLSQNYKPQNVYHF
jgi:hypothetical protein